ncbi:MAG: transcription elongation factor GreA [Armatimonadetes bacterium]|nr:transcription elongation factor GreA [Armatimonadota bacterium]MDE2207237.1 transcription elongation factor GreA [Armatimonadota bacterium]
MTGDGVVVITPQAYRRLEERLEFLRSVERKEIATRIHESLLSDDVSENTEYATAKTEQALVESEIMEIRRLLQLAQVLNDDDIPVDVAGIGSVITVTNLDDGDNWTFTLVGSVEANPDEDLISDESPIGLSMVGHKPGDEIVANVPAGVVRYRIDSIRK